jgi:hypothetical protein
MFCLFECWSLQESHMPYHLSFYFVAQYQIQLGSDDDTLSNSSRENVSTVSHIYLLQWEYLIVPLAWLDSGC